MYVLWGRPVTTKYIQKKVVLENLNQGKGVYRLSGCAVLYRELRKVSVEMPIDWRHE